MTFRKVTQARTLRQTAGRAEDRVWALLRGGKVDGHKFRRQHPIGRYIADFACESLRLVIEIDGGVHARDDVVTRDHLRQVELEDQGWTVARFSDAEVAAEPDRILARVREHARAVGL